MAENKGKGYGISFGGEIDDARYDAHDGEKEYHDTDDSVYEPHGAKVEVRTHLVDKIGHNPPPCKGTGKY